MKTISAKTVSAAILAMSLMAQRSAADIYINGNLVRQPDQLATIIGQQVPSGDYWLKNNGDWGYAGYAQPQNNIYLMNGGSHLLLGNGDWGYPGIPVIQGNIFAPPPAQAPVRVQGEFSRGGTDGTMARGPECDYWYVDGLAMKYCD